jgi:hypothetical protein
MNIHDPKYQLGKELFEAQILELEVRKGNNLDYNQVQKLCIRHCELISMIGELRAEVGVIQRQHQDILRDVKDFYRDFERRYGRERGDHE